MTATENFEQLLRDAIVKAKEAAPRASDDLFRYSSQVASAVERVTGGAAKLELVPLNLPDGARPSYQLLLRKSGSESPPSDLGVYNLFPDAGYPIHRWYSKSRWEAEPDSPTKTFLNSAELESHFRWLSSDPTSRLVILVMDLQRSTGSAQVAAANGS